LTLILHVFVFVVLFLFCYMATWLQIYNKHIVEFNLAEFKQTNNSDRPELIRFWDFAT